MSSSCFSFLYICSIFIVKCDSRLGFRGQFVALVSGSLFVKEGNYIGILVFNGNDYVKSFEVKLR